jgi:hypothetical protein
MSEASVKRMFSTGNFTLERLDEICAAAGIEFSELTRGFDREQHLIARLSVAQETEIVADPKLFLVAVCALNLLSYEDILATYDLAEAELVGLLARLDRIGIIELLPNNRFRLRIARTFSWIPNGPIQTVFKANAHDFFDSDFAGDDEVMVLLTGRLSRASSTVLIERIKRVAREFSDRHAEDSALPAADRPSMSLLMALRPWHPQFMRVQVRRPQAGAGRTSGEAATRRIRR